MKEIDRNEEIYKEFDFDFDNLVDKGNSNNILITGAVMASDPELVENYEKLVDVLNNNLPDTKNPHEIYSPLDTMKFKGTPEEKYMRAISLVRKSSVVIAEMSTVSTGQGMELQEATSLGLPILVIAKRGAKISSLVYGCPNVCEVLLYDDIYEVTEAVVDFVRRELDLANSIRRAKY